LFKYCQGCFKNIAAGGFCPECREELIAVVDDTSHGALQVTSLYRYHAKIRLAIMRAKVRSDVLALNGLCELFAGDARVLDLVARFYVVVPAPSSLWGRIRGRFDLAEACALRLAREVQLPIRSLPFKHYTKLHKRAGRNFSQLGANPLNRSSQGMFTGLSILLVDDIVTSGHTLRSANFVLQQLGAIRSQAVTLCAATLS